MLKKRIIAVVAGLALLMAVTGSGVAADWLGFSTTPQVHACGSGGSGGDCSYP